MGMIEDVRTLIQDLVTPDLKAMKVRLDTVEQRLDDLESTLDANHATVMAALDKRFTEIQTGISSLIRFNSIETRMAQLEAIVKEPKQQ